MARNWTLGDITQDDKKVLRVCIEFNKFRKTNPEEFQINKKIKKETKLDGKKIWRIKKKLIFLGLINEHYFVIDKESINKIIKEDDFFFTTKQAAFFFGGLIIIIISMYTFLEPAPQNIIPSGGIATKGQWITLLVAVTAIFLMLGWLFQKNRKKH